MEKLNKGDTLCFYQDGPNPRLVLASFARYTRSGNIVVDIVNKGLKLQCNIDKKDLRPVGDYKSTGLSPIDLRPTNVKASHEPGEG